jgi:hypothetical protein
MNRNSIIAVALALLLVIGVAVFNPRKPAPPAPATEEPVITRPEPAPEPQPSPEPVPMAPSVPVPPVEPEPLLPGLDDSDAEVLGALTDSLGREAVEGFLVSDQVVRKGVVTTDNLPGEIVATRIRAVRPTGGSFKVSVDDGRFTLSPDNYARYGAFVRVARSIDVEQAMGVYARYYPLLQEAYAELGYPSRQFNDRVIQVIDDLLGAPEPRPPIDLVRPRALYQFADPGLEALSAGQKILIRMGPENARVIKAKLREIRQALVDRSRTLATE